MRKKSQQQKNQSERNTSQVRKSGVKDAYKIGFLPLASSFIKFVVVYVLIISDWKWRVSGMAVGVSAWKVENEGK